MVFIHAYSQEVMISMDTFTKLSMYSDKNLDHISSSYGSDCAIGMEQRDNGCLVAISSDNQISVTELSILITGINQYVEEHSDETIDEVTIDEIFHHLKRKKPMSTKKTIIKKFNTQEPIKAKTDGQAKYVAAMENNLITFSVGPAGTGKSFLAIAMACSLLKHKKIEKIILSRPVVEAGESLGFLPGDLKDKIDPYMRPLYDSLYAILGKITVDMYIEKGIIEIAPLAYMRGRTLSDAFILLDEAQNATHEQLKMFLTRFGTNSRMVVDCDPTQIDLPNKKASCVSDIQFFQGIKDMQICTLFDEDVTRHPIIGSIIQAYRTHER